MACKENCNCTLFHKDVIDKVENKMKDDKTYIEISELLKVMSDLTRIKMLEAISEDELCVCDLGHVLGITKSAVSHQLKTLKKYNLVSSNRIGKMVYYKLKNKAIIDLIHASYKELRG
ncbi:ArsR/SmtB family transcription factor [Acholeplasma hippikon]|uniref:Transcriptional repressor smtB homolog n=1 Tax=Acholeplasma hippikon TaxID=264636 RepID=A0A449BKS6_9MOLU|nr:metalloregulator ArsR/SmtB family transcription factor [Acholeplasma hippikon]VEU82937.1 Transcriptional repressor smtB homolog [Acholeplasma hippikon]